MLHKEFWGLLFLGFVFWIVIATSPTNRIERVCTPIGWGGNVVTSLSALVLPKQQGTIQGWFDKLEYGCRYMTWRLFYQDDYNEWLKNEGLKQAEPSPSQAAPAKSEAVPSEQATDKPAE